MDAKWGKGAGRRTWEIGVDIYTLLILYTKYITNENILCSSGNSERKSKRDGIYIHVWLIHFAVQ